MTIRSRVFEIDFFLKISTNIRQSNMGSTNLSFTVVSEQAGDAAAEYIYSIGNFTKDLGSGPVTFNFTSSNVCAR